MSKPSVADMMLEVQREWNLDEEIYLPLQQSNFTAILAWGFKGKKNPEGILDVQNGIVVRAAIFQNEELSWDVRAKESSWWNWQTRPLTLTTMTFAVAIGKLQIKKGDFASLIKNPLLAGPFAKSFSLIAKVSALEL